VEALHKDYGGSGSTPLVFQRYTCILGSSLSRRKSPSILKLITVMLMARPGKITIQGAESVGRVECSETRHISWLFIISANIPAYNRRVSQKAFYPTYPADPAGFMPVSIRFVLPRCFRGRRESAAHSPHSRVAKRRENARLTRRLWRVAVERRLSTTDY
jgi:hypothetical protein